MADSLLLNDLRVLTEPQQGASYGDLLAVALRAEQLGFGAFFRSDHYLVMGDSDGLPGPTDAWITLAGLACDTSTIRLGTLVSSATFRYPGPLAISVAQVDQMSSGRIELGLGAGWSKAEHDEEQLEIITGLWSTPEGSTFDKPGGHYPVANSPALPKPHSGAPPIVIGGSGPKRTPALAAKYATEFNALVASQDLFTAQCDRVRSACDAIDRDPAEITNSVSLVVCCGANETEFERRATSLGRKPADLRQHGLGGTPAEVAEQIRAWQRAGADRIYLQILDLADLEQLDLIASAIVSQARRSLTHSECCMSANQLHRNQPSASAAIPQPAILLRE